MLNFKRLIPGSFILIVIFITNGCEKFSPPGKSRNDRVLAQINGYKMTVSDFNDEKKPFLNYAQIPGDPVKLKDQILSQLITRQLLLQEAQRLDLDKDKAFMKEIENYWKQALLTSLLRKKTDEFKGNVTVTEAEIEAEYASMQRSLLDEKDSRVLVPLKDMRPRIIEQIKKEKTGRSLEAWINKLTREAQIDIDPKTLQDIKLN